MNYPFLQENKEKYWESWLSVIPYYVGPLARGNGDFKAITGNSDQATDLGILKKLLTKQALQKTSSIMMTNYDLYLLDGKSFAC